MPLGGAAFMAIGRRHAVTAFVAALAFGTLLSLSVEVAQLWLPNRSGNFTDLASNSAGTLFGIVVAILATTPAAASRLRTLHSPAFLLVGLWAVWQAFLFLPRYGPSIDVSHVVVGVVVLLLCVLRRPFRLAVPLLLMWLIFEELRPFRFQSPPQPFWWLPFESWFGGAPDTYYGSLFGKLFFYTAIVWVERKSGMRRIWALAVPAAILFTGELAQCYLPGRTPETTDVALLAGGAVLLNLAEPQYPRHNKGSA
jgi:VanZ family protein